MDNYVTIYLSLWRVCFQSRSSLKYTHLPKIRHTLKHAVLSSATLWPGSFQPVPHQACELWPYQATILAAIYNPTLPSSPLRPLLFLFCFYIWSHFVAQAGLELTVTQDDFKLTSLPASIFQVPDPNFGSGPQPRSSFWNWTMCPRGPCEKHRSSCLCWKPPFLAQPHKSQLSRCKLTRGLSALPRQYFLSSYTIYFLFSFILVWFFFKNGFLCVTVLNILELSL